MSNKKSTRPHDVVGTLGTDGYRTINSAWGQRFEDIRLGGRSILWWLTDYHFKAAGESMLRNALNDAIALLKKVHKDD
jgi:hypothetical protein